MKKLVNDLKKKISGCKFFTVLSTKNYARELRNKDSDVSTQVRIARELNIPFVIIKDRRLSNDEVEEINKYFSKDNIIKELIIDMSKENSVLIITSEIRKIMSLTHPCADQKISIITQDSIDKDKMIEND